MAKPKEEKTNVMRILEQKNIPYTGQISEKSRNTVERTDRLDWICSETKESE